MQVGECWIDTEIDVVLYKAFKLNSVGSFHEWGQAHRDMLNLLAARDSKALLISLDLYEHTRNGSLKVFCKPEVTLWGLVHWSSSFELCQ